MVYDETDQRQRLLFKVCLTKKGGFGEVESEGKDLFSCLFVMFEQFQVVT